MNFFCTKKHYDRWTSRYDVDRNLVFCLDVQEALAVARMLFRVEG